MPLIAVVALLLLAIPDDAADLTGTLLNGANLTQAIGMTSDQDAQAKLDDVVTCPDGQPAGSDRSCVGQGGTSSPGLARPPVAAGRSE